MSLTWSPDSPAPGNQTYGMPRRSAKRICLPNFAAAGATSTGIPRCRRAAATRMPWARSSSAASATRTQVGVGRLADRPCGPTSRPSSRETPIEMPTPGYVVFPSEASAS